MDLIYTPYDEYKFPAYNWEWYKVHDYEELQQVLRLAAEVYAMKNCSDDRDDFDQIEFEFYHGIKILYGRIEYGLTSEQRRKFPKYIAISYDQKCIDILDNIAKHHKMEIEKWEKFLSYFKNNGGFYEDKDMA